MSNSKVVGTRFETAVVGYLKTRGAPHAERRALNGKLDRGDIAGMPGVVHECKAGVRYDLAGWMRELEVEVVNDNAAIGLLWVKRKGKGDPKDCFVVMTGHAATELLLAAGYLDPAAVTG